MNWKKFLGLCLIIAGIFAFTPTHLFAQQAATSPSFAATDIVIDEVFYVGTASTDWVELRNSSTTDTIDVSTWWTCAKFSYAQLNSLTLQPGDDLVLSPGETVRFRPSANLDNTSSDFGIYTSPSFGSAAAMVDFVQWGTSADVGRSDVAVAKGIWSETSPGVYDFAPTAGAGQSMQFDGTNGGGGLLTLSTDFSSGTPTAISFQSTDINTNASFTIILLAVLLLVAMTGFVWRNNKRAA
jgi:hypothetical protein